MPITAVIQIGNSDDRLSQAKWSTFISHLNHWLDRNCEQVHFAGCSPASMPWQNACFVITIASRRSVQELRERLAMYAANYEQDSIALTIGNTELIGPSVIRAIMPNEWLYRNWSIDCFSEIHDQATLFNRTDPKTVTDGGWIKS